MAKFTVGTSAVKIVDGRSWQPSVRNLGPGNVGLGYSSAVTVADAGIYLEPGDAYDWPSDLGQSSDGEVWAISDTAGTDVRVEQVG